MIIAKKENFNEHNILLPNGARRNSRFTWKKHRSIPARKALFCIQHEGHLVYLSSVLGNIDLSYELLLKYLWYFQIGIDCEFQFIYDQEFKKPIGEYKDALVVDDYLKEVLIEIGISEDETEKIFTTAKYFSYNLYESFVIKREIDHSPDGMTADTYLKKIELYPQIRDAFENDLTDISIADSIREHVESNRLNPTTAEKEVMKILDSANIPYIFQHPVKAMGATYILDFYLPDKNVCIEIDGEYHDELSQIYKDKIRDIKLSRSGVFVVRFCNKEIMLPDCPLKAFLQRVLGYNMGYIYDFVSFNYPTTNIERKD